MNYADYALLAVIAISLLVGVLRGFVKEVLALAVWAAAFLAAFQFSGLLAERMTRWIELPSGRTALAFGGIFLLVLAIGGLLVFLIGKLVEKTGLSGTDRLLGGVFGGLRGLLLVLALLIIAGFTPVPKDRWWQESRAIQSLLPLAEWAAQFLPETVHEYLDLYRTAGELQRAEA